MYLGLELCSSSSGCAGRLCLLTERGDSEFLSCRSLEDVITLIPDSGAAVLAVGSPLSVDMDINGKLKTRAAERALRKLEHPACLNPRFGPLPPQLLRARALDGGTLKTRIWEKAPGLKIIETHASSASEFLGLPAWWAGKKSRAIRTDSIYSLLPDLAGKPIMENPPARRAALNAFTAREFSRNRTIAFGDSQEGEIHVPKPRSPRLVIMDVDGTLTTVSSPWRHIHQLFGVWDGIGESILNRWLAGVISYDTFCRRDVELWRRKRAGRSEVENILDSIEIRPGAVALLRALRAKNLKLAMLSSGFTRVARRICRSAGMEDEVIVIANRLYENKRGEVSVEVKVSGDGNSGRSKGAHVRRLCSQLGISPVACVGIGDGPSDRYLFERCGQSIIVNKSEDLVAAADLIAPGR